MNKEQREIVKKYIDELKVLLSDRMRGDIKDMTFRQIDTAYASLDDKLTKAAQKEIKK